MSQKEETVQKLSQLRDQADLGDEVVENALGDGSALSGELGTALLDGIDPEDLDADQLGAIGEAVGRRVGAAAGRKLGERLGRWLDDLLDTEDAVLDSIAEQLGQDSGSSDGEDGANDGDGGDESGGDDLDEMSTEDLQALADDLMDELDERTD